MGAEADDLPVPATEVEAEMDVRLANLNVDGGPRVGEAADTSHA